jgi:hypothetical protein
MAKKRTGQDRPGKGSPDQLKSRIRASSVTRTQGARKLSERSQSTRGALLNVASDMRRNPKLTFTQACQNRGVDPRSRRSYAKSLFYKNASGRVGVRKSDPYSQKMSIPSVRPDVLIHFVAKGSGDRHLVGEWMASLNEAARGEFNRLKRFPKGIVIDGVRLPTDAHEVQKILEAMEGAETPFERLYEMGGAS